MGMWSRTTKCLLLGKKQGATCLDLPSVNYNDARILPRPRSTNQLGFTSNFSPSFQGWSISTRVISPRQVSPRQVSPTGI